tara:strand:- start:2588 stop:3079 length:492 start_codon:yes stop_codon:yes gene_type:complete
MKSLLFFKKLSMTKAALLAASPILTLIFGMRTILIALFIIILIDMVTGIRKSLFQNDTSRSIFKADFWRCIKSAGIRKTWRKTYEYIIGILAFMILDVYVLKTGDINVLSSTRSLSEFVVAIACVIEVYSIFENMEAVSGRNLLKKVVSLLPEKIKTIFKKSE